MFTQYHGIRFVGGLITVGGLWLTSVVAGATAAAATQDDTEPVVFRVYVGTYTGGSGDEKSEGIYLLDLDPQSGKLGPPRLAGKAINPSFLAVHPNLKFLYAVSEVGGRRGGCSPRILHRSGDRKSDRNQRPIIARKWTLPSRRRQGREKCSCCKLRQWKHCLLADRR